MPTRCGESRNSQGRPATSGGGGETEWSVAFLDGGGGTWGQSIRAGRQIERKIVMSAGTLLQPPVFLRSFIVPAPPPLAGWTEGGGSCPSAPARGAVFADLWRAYRT